MEERTVYLIRETKKKKWFGGNVCGGPVWVHEKGNAFWFLEEEKAALVIEKYLSGFNCEILGKTAVYPDGVEPYIEEV